MCLYPNKGYIYYNEQGERKVSWQHEPKNCYYEVIDIPCNNCIECYQAYSNEWALRCALEASLYDKNCFITLTYSESPLTVSKRELQLFLKLLRRRIDPVKIRYFACGEYGSKGLRPHYHLCIFGWAPDDMTFFYEKDGNKVYLSDFVASVWHDCNKDMCHTHGFVTVQEMSYLTARYCAKYLQKINDVPEGALPPFTMCSLKPAIGFCALDLGSVLHTGNIAFNGKQYKLPKAYLRKLKNDEYFIEHIVDYRLSAAVANRRSRAQLIVARDKARKFAGKKYLKKVRDFA